MSGTTLLDHVWVIPAITFVSFWLILFFGKRLRWGGSEIGLAAVGIALLLSVLSFSQWVDQPKVAEPAGTAVEATNQESQTPAATSESEGESHAIRQAVEHNKVWFTIGDVEITVGTAVDGFTVVMLFVVSFISFLVHVFSTNYMEGDVRFTHFFAMLSLFTTGMLLLVVSSSTFQVLFGWELMG